MLIYIWDLSAKNHKCAPPVVQTEQQKRTHICRTDGQICVCFFVVLEDGAYKQNCEMWLHSDKTRVSKGYPFGTQPLEQRCSVLYLLAWLTPHQQRLVRAVAFRFARRRPVLPCLCKRADSLQKIMSFRD